MLVLAVDPGTRKCGVAVVHRGEPSRTGELPRTCHRAVVPTTELPDAIRALLICHPIDAVIIGDATHAGDVESVLRPLLDATVPIIAVPEAFTSEQARARWCSENPPRNLWERCFPGFRTPPCPVDDYAAVILAERYLAATGG